MTIEQADTLISVLKGIRVELSMISFLLFMMIAFKKMA